MQFSQGLLLPVQFCQHPLPTSLTSGVEKLFQALSKCKKWAHCGKFFSLPVHANMHVHGVRGPFPHTEDRGKPYNLTFAILLPANTDCRIRCRATRWGSPGPRSGTVSWKAQSSAAAVAKRLVKVVQEGAASPAQVASSSAKRESSPGQWALTGISRGEDRRSLMKTTTKHLTVSTVPRKGGTRSLIT